MQKRITLEVDLPYWTRWVAQDLDGTWRAFQNNPTAGSRWWDADAGRSEIIAKGHAKQPGWKGSLIKV